MLRWRSWYSSALLLAALPAVVHAQIYSVQHEPSNLETGDGPERLAILNVNRGGQQSDTAIKYQSQFIYIGCFWAPQTITMDSEQDTSFDPAECVDVCKSKAPIFPSGEIVAAVQGKLCGCVKPPQTDDNPRRLMQVFQVSDQPTVDCQTGCKFYDNPLCGGNSDNGYWGVFKEYDFQSMSSQGAYDPWRYIWYTVVVMLERTIHPSYIEDGLPLQDDEDVRIPPERYYLSAIDQQTGKPMFPFQAQLPGLIQGLQFDLDSNRLVGLLVSNEIGRVRFTTPWTYKLIHIFINTTTPTFPNMTFENDYPSINLQEDLEKEQFLYTGASAIVSRKNWDVFVFVLVQDMNVLKSSLNNIYFVQIPSGNILLTNPLDMRVVQMFSNEKYGDVTVAGIWYKQMVWLYIARVTFNEYTQDTEIKYSYSGSRPEFLVDPPEQREDTWLYPGGSCSDHLYNKSYSLTRNMSVDYKDNRFKNETGILMMEVLIRAQTYDYFCDKEKGCWESMNQSIPYAAIFNREPRIPLSLKSPELISAKFDMEAVHIYVMFDQSTLRGAIPRDTNNDILPDFIDYSTQLTGEWDCARIFDDPTVVLIGPYQDGTKCTWLSELEIKIELPRGENYPIIDVGNELFLRPDTIYTVPRDGEYSFAGQGGIQVSLPDPLVPPSILVTGANTVDECTPAEFKASDSYNVGGAPQYNWSLSQPMIDLTGNPAGRIWDPLRVTYIYEALDNATKDNSAVLSLDTKRLSPAAKYMILLEVKSRWGLTSNETIELTRLDFPSPLVDIVPATAEIIRNRTDEVILTAVGTPSLCVGVSRELAYSWTETTGKLDMDQIAVRNSKTLIIPKFVMEPDGPVGQYNVYNFTVLCYVVSHPDRAATDWIVVKIQRSPVFAHLSLEDRLVTRGTTIFFDARYSQDADYPTTQTFKGTFTWWCVGPGNTPCFSNLDGALVGTTNSLPVCSTNINEKIYSGGHQFTQVIWQDGKPSYCKWARGALAVNTANFSIDNYTWTVEAQAHDGRKANISAITTVTEYDIPSILLKIKDPMTKYPNTRQIRVEGTIEGEIDPAANVVFLWSIYEYLPNPNFDQDAYINANQQGLPYDVPAFTYQDVSGPLELSPPHNANKFSLRSDTPNLIIEADVLKASAQYKIRLTVALYEFAVTSFVSIQIQMAGPPPRPGKFICDPLNASMDAKRIFSAPEWVADETPLNYNFGYVKMIGSMETKVPFLVEALPVSTFERGSVPLGEPSTNYTLRIYVDVTTPFHVTNTMYMHIQSKPPSNVSDTTITYLTRMEANKVTDPESVFDDGESVMSIQGNPDLPPGVMPPTGQLELMTQVVDLVEEAAQYAPVTKGTIMQRSGILDDVIAQGGRTEQTMNAVVSTIDAGLLAGLYSTQNPEVITAGMEMLSGMLPDCASPGACLPNAAAAEEFGGGRRLESAKRSKKQRQKGVSEDPGHIKSTIFGRQEQNHPAPTEEGEVIHSCPTAYCDEVALQCARYQRKGIKSQWALELADNGPRLDWFTCCDSVNPGTKCSHPPCWFRGSKCPMPEEEEVSEFAQRSPNAERRLQGDTRILASGDWDWQWSEELGYRSLNAHKSVASRKSANFSMANSSDYTSDALERSLEARLLQASTPLVGSRGVESEARIQFLEGLEDPILKQVRSDIASRSRQEEQRVRADARLELSYAQMTPIKAEVARKVALDAKTEALEALRWDERQQSQRITKVAVSRDKIAKEVITQMATSIETWRVDTTGFTVWWGKTRNLSSVRPSMVFPDTYIVPPNTPDERTADNPLTAFAYIYVEYKKNIYGWSRSAPPGNESNIITIVVMQASTKEIKVEKEDPPIHVFADESLYSSSLCMYWDRFAPGTAGGAWSGRGLLNDGEGCLTTHLSDIGLFVDGRIPTTILVDKAVSYYLEDTIDGPEGSKFNLITVAVVGFSIFLGTTLALAGYIQDELIRERERAGKAPHTHWLGGDGVTAPVNVDDCIAYNHVQKRNWFLVITLWKVMLRDHAVLGLFRYHAAFTRPQRILCLGVMATSVLAVNAMIYGVPKELVSGDQFVPSGVISGLVAFPLFVACMFMFASRPTLLKKRLIKRATDTSIPDAMRQEREKIEFESAKLYPKSNPALAQLPMVMQGHAGHGSLLALPAPVPLWPTVPAPPGGMILPPPPPTTMLPIGNAPPGMMMGGMMGARTGLPALAGLPSLPPLPPLKPSAVQMVPPPPKYNPPSATLSRPGLPPPGRGLAQLPPHPAEQNRLGQSILDGDTRTPPPGTPPAETQTPRDSVHKLPELPSTVPVPKTPPGGPNRPPDNEMTTTVPGSLAPEGTHGTAPELAADTEVTQLPAERELQDDAQHGMMMGQPGVPYIPPPPSEPPPEGRTPREETGGFATPRTPTSQPPSEFGTFQMAPIMTPPSGPGFHGMHMPTTSGISASGIVFRGEAPPMIPPPSYAPGQGTQDIRHPPEPPNALRLPQTPGLPKMQTLHPPMGFGLPPGVPGPLVPGKGGLGLPPGLEGLKGMPPPGGFMPGGFDQGRKPLPPPPPPPKEDDSVFVRRGRLIYLEKSAKEQKRLLVEHLQDPGKDIPSKIYLAMTLCPYIACLVSICAQVFVTLVYSMKFQRIAETYWYYSTIIGLCEVLLVLEFMRSAVMMIVELRKFEIRRRLAGGDFNTSRVGRKLKGPDALKPNQPKARTPKVPTVAVKKPSTLPPPPPPKDKEAIEMGPPPLESLASPDQRRPAFLPPTGTPPGPPGTGLSLPGVSLPFGKAPPPLGAPPSSPPPSHKMPSGMMPLDFRKGIPGSSRGGSMLGQSGGPSLLPGGLKSSNTPPLGTPPLGNTPKGGQSFNSASQSIPGPPPMPSKARPGSPTESVGSMSKSLSEKMAASRSGMPPPPKQPTPPGSQRGGAKPPSAPPPSQNVAQKRAAMRGQ